MRYRAGRSARVAPQPRLAPVRMAVDDTPALGRRAALFGAAAALARLAVRGVGVRAAEAGRLREKARASEEEAAAKAALQRPTASRRRRRRRRRSRRRAPAAATVKQGKAANAKKAKQAAAAAKAKAKKKKAKRKAAARRRGGGPRAFLGNIVLLGGAGIAGLALLGDEEA